MWRTVKLGDVCNVRRGETITKKQTVAGSVPVVGGGTKPTYFHNKSNRNSGCITVSGSGANAGYVNKWEISIFASDCSTVEVKDEKISNQFVYYYLLSCQDYIYKNFRSGAAQPHVYAKDIASLNFPILPLAEQQRIVEKLDRAFAEIDGYMIATETAITNANNLFLSTLSNIYKQHMKRQKVGEVAECKLGKMLDKNKNKGTKKPYLRNLNVRWFEVDVKDVLLMNFEEKEFDRYSVKRDDLVICEGGYPGRAAIWENNESIFFQKAIHRVRFQRPIYNRWLMYYLFLLDKTDRLREHFTGMGIQHFTGKALSKLELPMPSQSEVEVLVKNIEALKKLVKLFNEVQHKKIDAIQLLKSSILKQALQPPKQ